jgi:hypothetical protein
MSNHDNIGAMPRYMLTRAMKKRVDKFNRAREYFNKDMTRLKRLHSEIADRAGEWNWAHPEATPIIVNGCMQLDMMEELREIEINE